PIRLALRLCRRRRGDAREPCHLSLRPGDAAGGRTIAWQRRRPRAQTARGRRAPRRARAHRHLRAGDAVLGRLRSARQHHPALGRGFHRPVGRPRGLARRVSVALVPNRLLICVFTPLIVRLWARQARLGPEPFPITKMAFGCLCVALANLVMAAAASNAAGKASALWLVGYFVLATIGELHLAPVG